MIQLAVLLLSTFSVSLCKFACQSPVVCDPSLESEIFLNAFHFLDETQCESSCILGHPNNPCKFFTWVPNAQAQVPNCFQMRECKEMSDPMNGGKSGAWNCEDPEIFCPAIGEIPAYDTRRTTWTCDHNVHPYGGEDKHIFQDTTCRATCPSFAYSDGTLQRTDVVVASTCIGAGAESVWSDAVPDNVVDVNGTSIESASTNPEPYCGCKDLVLTGEVQEEDGKAWQCEIDPTIEDGNTVITDENTCFLTCDGYQVWELYCSMGQWSEDWLQDASEIYCHGGGTTVTGDADVTKPLSTFWPPGK